MPFLQFDSWMPMASGLLGAIIGALASMGAQLITQRQIRRREDRDKLRDACAKYAECAIRFVQAAESAVLASAEVGALGPLTPLSPGDPEQRFKFVVGAGAAQDAYSASLCRLVMFRHARTDIDDGEALYRRLMTIPKVVSHRPGESSDDLSRQCSQHRQDILEWLQAQSQRLS